MLAQISTPEAIRESADAQLAPLVRADGEDGLLLHTLRAYLEHDRRLAETSRALHVHVNTLRYRIQRIAALLEADLDDPDVRASLQLAIRVQGLLPREE